MHQEVSRGQLNERPLSFLLYELWRHKNTGTLTLNKNKEEKILTLEKGGLTVYTDTFDDTRFFYTLIEKKIIDSSSVQDCRAHAEKNQMSSIKSCVDLEMIKPERLWELIQEHMLNDISLLFDWDEATYSFQPDSFACKVRPLCLLPTLDVILHGTRQMTNIGLIKSSLPKKETKLQALFPPHMPQLTFQPHEEYLLQLTAGQPSLKTIYALSELSLRETQKVIFTFLSLGLFSLPLAKERQQPLSNFSQAELDKILSAFDKKWISAFKHVSKEIGPVAVNVMEKTLEEAKTRLPPLFQNIRLQPDGRIDTRSILKAKFNFSTPEIKQYLLVGLNEILVSEVLTVKKFLGDEHEATVVRNLGKIKT
ncbi:MAG: hypothetical protein PVF22_00515 [Candidatus Aminicenantes bacterium]|jgi:hypothetical protein